MTSHTNGTQSAISPDLFEILRDPQAIQEGGHGDDPGRLQLVRGSWLVSADTGYKYPIRDGIPVMLVEEGARWKDTPIDALPVPPPTAEPAADIRAAEAATSQNPTTMPDYRLLLAAGAILLFLLAVLTLGRKRSTGQQSLPPAT